MNPKSLLFGVATGDALGVPVEFKARSYLKEHPVTGMIGNGTHNQPAGTWSDDSSMTFCLAESLAKGFDPKDIGNRFVKWRFEEYWTPHGRVFDFGNTTDQAINRLRNDVKPEKAGGTNEHSNGNGSLMRIAPLMFYVMDKPIDERWEVTKQVSSITHGHIRSIIACFYYLEFFKQVLEKKGKFEIYKNLQTEISSYLKSLSISPKEIALFDRLLNGKIYELSDDKIKSSGYVLHTLEAAVWCLLSTDSYKTAVLKAVNLGYDSDTTGAVTGGLAGLLYGYKHIPEEWINQLARKDDIRDLATRLTDEYAA